MKKQFFLLGAAAIFGFAACNDSSTDTTTTTDSANATSATTSTYTAPTRGVEIANFSNRTFMDVKTNKPIKLRWDTVHYYYVDEMGNQPYFYYDPATKDTFDYWGRRLNDYLIYENNEFRIDESRVPPIDTTATMSTSGDIKIKATDDKYKEKTDTSKLKITDDKMKAKKK